MYVSFYFRLNEIGKKVTPKTFRVQTPCKISTLFLRNKIKQEKLFNNFTSLPFQKISKLITSILQISNKEKVYQKENKRLIYQQDNLHKHTKFSNFASEKNATKEKHDGYKEPKNHPKVQNRRSQ